MSLEFSFWNENIRRRAFFYKIIGRMAVEKRNE